MGINIGDTVMGHHGHAKVIDVFLLVQWNSSKRAALYPAACLKPIERKFAVGQFVRITADDDTNGEVGIIYEDDGTDEYSDPYHVALYDDDASEEWYSADEMIPWLPKIGERVIEAGVEDDDEGGTVITVSPDGRVKVLWDSFPHAQDWLVSDLEPEDKHEDDDDDDKLKEGDEVEYTNPMFSGSCKATVTKVEGEGVSVKFASGPFRDGLYHRDFFTKAA